LSSSDFGACRPVGESSFVGDHHPPDVVHESSLEAARGLVAGLAFGDLLGFSLSSAPIEPSSAVIRIQLETGHFRQSWSSTSW